MACLISALYVGTLTRVVSIPFSESSFARAPIIYVLPTPNGPAKYNPFWYEALSGVYPSINFNNSPMTACRSGVSAVSEKRASAIFFGILIE